MVTSLISVVWVCVYVFLFASGIFIMSGDIRDRQKYDIPIGTASFIRRKTKAQYFENVFGFAPLGRKDVLGIEVGQSTVTHKLTELGGVYQGLLREKEERLSVSLSPEEIQKRINENRDLYSEVKRAKELWEDAEWLAEIFGFKIQKSCRRTSPYAVLGF